MAGKSSRTTFKQIRAFLREYHKLSIEAAYGRIQTDHRIHGLFRSATTDTLRKMAGGIPEDSQSSRSGFQTPRAMKQQRDEDTRVISAKLASSYSQMNADGVDMLLKQTDDDRQREKMLLRTFRDTAVQEEWWRYIDDILDLIERDYSISMALYKGKIFSSVPQVFSLRDFARKCSDLVSKLVGWLLWIKNAWNVVKC